MSHMKKVNKMYYILTYMFFLYPPFIWGLVSIYSNSVSSDDHIATLYINLILLLVLIAAIAGAIYFDKLHVPTQTEQKYLLFGLIGNIVMYFYTFQNALNISNFVTVYLLLIVVLGVFTLLISKTIKPLELWILLPLFIAIDYIHLAITGCGWTDYNCGNVSNSGETIIIILYFVMLISIFLYYIKQIVQYQLIDPFKLIHGLLGIIIIIMFQNIMDLSTSAENLLMTLLIALAFLLIVDFIVSIVNKTYTHRMTLFYIRTLTLIAIGMLTGMIELFKDPSVEKEFLGVMVAVTYISLGINILKPLLGVTIPDTFKLSPTTPKLNYHFTEEMITDIHQITMLKDDIEIGLYGYRIENVTLNDTQQVNIISFDIPDEPTDQKHLIEEMLKDLRNVGDTIVFESIKFNDTLDELLKNYGFTALYHNETHLMSYILEI